MEKEVAIKFFKLHFSSQQMDAAIRSFLEGRYRLYPTPTAEAHEVTVKKLHGLYKSDDEREFALKKATRKKWKQPHPLTDKEEFEIYEITKNSQDSANYHDWIEQAKRKFSHT